MRKHLASCVASIRGLKGGQQLLLALTPLVLTVLLAAYLTWANIESQVAVWCLHLLTWVGAIALGALTVAGIRRRQQKTHPILLTVIFLLIAVAYSYAAFLIIFATILAVWF